MNIGTAIAWRYPDADPSIDYIVVVDPHTGEQSIEAWNLSDPQPTDSELQSWWVSYLKESKIAELKAKCAQTVLSGFTSSATGEPHTYGFDEKDQRNLTEQLSILLLDPSITSVKWKTLDAGIITLTRDQFIQVCKDANTFKRSNIERLWDLVSQVQAATTEDEINAINW